MDATRPSSVQAKVEKRRFYWRYVDAAQNTGHRLWDWANQKTGGYVAYLAQAFKNFSAKGSAEAVIFGPGDILMNNVAWLLRRSPVFAIAGDGTYRVRPVHVDDVAALCVKLAAAPDQQTVDAVGPDSFSFEDMVRQIRSAVGSRSRIVHVPAALARYAGSAIGLVVRDVLITDHELGGLMSEKAYSDGPTTGERGFADWLREVGPTLGRRYTSEIVRHFT